VKAFYVDSLVPELFGYRDVEIRWFYADRRPAPLVPYHDAIEGYTGQDSRDESAVDDLFSQEEAEALSRYLADFPGTTTVEEARLPFPKDSIGCSAIPLGGPQQDYDLSKHEGYPLAFKVLGYYDRRNCDLAEETKDAGPSLFDEEPSRNEDAGASFHEELGRAVSGMAEAIDAAAPMLPGAVLARLREAHQGLFVAAAQVITGRKVHVSESPMDTLRLLGRRFDGPPAQETPPEGA